MIVAGVEEAGRGPVIGPMVMAICAIDESRFDELKKLGVKDSKLLSINQREFLFSKVKELCAHKIIVLSPLDVDSALLDPSMNLNKLEAVTSASLIEEVSADKVILDCPSNNIPAYREYVSSLLNKKIEVVAEHKADLNHVIVGAASILAKVTRDRIIEELKKEVGVNFGSGYPSDPLTIKFLKENWNKYDFFRKTWATYKKVASSASQTSLF